MRDLEGGGQTVHVNASNVPDGPRAAELVRPPFPPPPPLCVLEGGKERLTRLGGQKEKGTEPAPGGEGFLPVIVDLLDEPEGQTQS